MKNLQQEEKLIDLLLKREHDGLFNGEEKELEELLTLFPEWGNDETISLTAAAINLTAVSVKEKFPVELRSKILADAQNFFAARENAAETDVSENKSQTMSTAESGGFFASLFGMPFVKWGGWAIAAACAVLALNLWLARPPQVEVVKNPPPRNTPTVAPGLAEQREQLLATAQDTVQSKWTDFNPKQPRGVEGDVVWSNSQQKGFLRIHGMPVNDKSKETYQLWIFDAAQNAKTPIDGGVFDVDSDGDVIIPITAKIKVQKPTMFAVTAEKTGGVVVSELGKVMTVAKI